MIIGFTGYARHGKDTAGRVLVDEYGFTRLAFADAVKEMALACDPLIPGREVEISGSDDLLVAFENMERLSELVAREGWERAKKNPEVRRFLQAMGTEAGRDVLGEDVWVAAAKKKILFTKPPIFQRTANFAITDVRFPNEERMIHDMDGEVWRITRKNSDGTDYDNGLGTGHSSEQHIANLNVDREISAYEISDLKEQIRTLADKKLWM